MPVCNNYDQSHKPYKNFKFLFKLKTEKMDNHFPCRAHKIRGLAKERKTRAKV